MNRRRQQAEQTKRHILETVLALVREEGFAALSANRITQRAGISKGGFFHHFPQIEDLYLYLLEEMLASMGEDLAPGKFEDFRHYISVSARYVIAMVEETPETLTTLYFFLSQSRHNEAYRRRLEDMVEAALTEWAAGIGSFFDPPLDPAVLDTVTRMTDAFFNGFAIHVMIIRDRSKYTKLADDFAGMITAYIETHPPRDHRSPS